MKIGDGKVRLFVPIKNFIRGSYLPYVLESERRKKGYSRCPEKAGHRGDMRGETQLNFK